MTSEEFRTNPLFLRNQFNGDGIFEMPIIKRQDIDLDNVKLIGYDKTKLDDGNTQNYVHFFLDDYKFEVIWNDPEPRLEKLSQYKGVLSPQFSTFYTMPVPLQIYNTFRSRWCGAYFQSKGFKVIPTVSWGLPQSYWYCFDGIEKGSVVAVSTLGVKKEKDFFMQGYNELLRRIKPEAIICYCKPFEEMKGNIITVEYDETNNLKQNKTFYGSNSYYIKKQVGYIIKGFGGGVGNNDSDNSGNSINNQPPKKPLKELPENIKDSYDKYQTSGWKNHKDQTPGTKAGKIYENDPPKLPTKDKNGNNLTYREYDVNNKLPGQSRDGERFVRDNNGKTYYTDDHYDTFTEITED